MGHEWRRGALYPEATECRLCGCKRVTDREDQFWYVTTTKKGLRKETKKRPKCVPRSIN